MSKSKFVQLQVYEYVSLCLYDFSADALHLN